jgi:hypothetical protein
MYGEGYGEFSGDNNAASPPPPGQRARYLPALKGVPAGAGGPRSRARRDRCPDTF